MKVEVVKETAIHITLTEQEALWLRYRIQLGRFAGDSVESTKIMNQLYTELSNLNLE